MGFFSWDCKGCDHSIREGRGWMSRAVAQGDDGDTASGEYDGYGRLDGSMGEITLGDRSGQFALWHKACFKLAGRPAYSGPSRSARDQGMSPADEIPEPQRAEDLLALKELAAIALRKDKEGAKAADLAYIAELKAQGKPIPSWLQESQP